MALVLHQICLKYNHLYYINDYRFLDKTIALFFVKLLAINLKLFHTRYQNFNSIIICPVISIQCQHRFINCWVALLFQLSAVRILGIYEGTMPLRCMGFFKHFFTTFLLHNLGRVTIGNTPPRMWVTLYQRGFSWLQLTKKCLKLVHM